MAIKTYASTAGTASELGVRRLWFRQYSWCNLIASPIIVNTSDTFETALDERMFLALFAASIGVSHTETFGVQWIQTCFLIKHTVPGSRLLKKPASPEVPAVRMEADWGKRAHENSGYQDEPKWVPFGDEHDHGITHSQAAGASLLLAL